MKPPAPDFKLRLSPDLREQIDRAAKLNSRSVNGEIVARLEATLRAETQSGGGFSFIRPPMGGDPATSEIDDLRRQLDDLRARMEKQENAMSVVKDACYENGLVRPDIQF